VTALVRMRLLTYIRTGRFILPLLLCLVLLFVSYGGAPSGSAQAYAISATLLFPVLAWQTKLLLDAEPDVQRKIALVSLGSRRREVTAGLIAAAIVAVPLVLLALVLPWIFGAVTVTGAGSGVLLGLWAHLILVPAALAVGAWSSRVIAGPAGRATAILASSLVLAFVLGLRGSPAPWLAPPLISTAKMLSGNVSPATVLGYTFWALAWGAVVLAGYGWLRRSRA
jgi:hypothetical protein